MSIVPVARASRAPRRPPSALATLLATALLAVAAPSLASAQAVERVVLRGNAAVYDLVGTVRVVGAEGTGDVVAEVTRKGADASRLKLATGTIGARETLRIVFPGDRIRRREMGARNTTHMTVRDDGTFGGGWGRGERSNSRRVTITGDEGLDASADVVVRVPAGRTVAVFLGVGEAFVSNVNGDITVDVASANVTTERTRGKLLLDTGSGALSVTDAEGELMLDTGSGRVTLNRIRGAELVIDAGSGDVTGRDVSVRRLSLDLGSGRTRLTDVAAPSMLLDTGSGDTDLSVVGDVDELRVDSGSGDVTLRLPAGIGAKVDVDAGSGGVDTELAMTFTRRDRRTLSGRIGDGRGTIRIDAGSGTVRLLKR